MCILIKLWVGKGKFVFVCFGIWELPKIFWDCASPYKSRCQKWTQAHLYTGDMTDTHLGSWSQNRMSRVLKIFLRGSTQSFQSDQDGRISTRGKWALPNVARYEIKISNTQQMHYLCRFILQMKRISLSCHEQTSPDSLGKEGSRLTQALYYLVVKPPPLWLASEGPLGAIFSHSFWRVAWELFHDSNFSGWNLMLQGFELLSQHVRLGVWVNCMTWVALCCI